MPAMRGKQSVECWGVHIFEHWTPLPLRPTTERWQWWTERKLKCKKWSGIFSIILVVFSINQRRSNLEGCPTQRCKWWTCTILGSWYVWVITFLSNTSNYVPCYENISHVIGNIFSLQTGKIAFIFAAFNPISVEHSPKHTAENFVKHN